MAMAFKRASLLTVTPASSRLPCLNSAWGFSVAFCKTRSDRGQGISSDPTKRSFCLARTAIFQGFPRHEKQKLKIAGVLNLKEEEEEGAAENLQQQSLGDPQRIWVRKQSKTRALGLDKFLRSTDGEGIISGHGGELKRHGEAEPAKHWFPHADSFQILGGTTVSSGAALELLNPLMSEERKQRIETVVDNRTYAVCTVVEGLSDVGNVSAICRTADAMGFQSIHVISNSKKVRYRENTRTSAGAEKWLDMEKWDDTPTCIKTLKARGYRIAVTHIADDTVSIHDMDWTVPTAVVLGNEHKGISEEAIALSDVRCSIPMAGMVESFNVSVAAAIVMHHAVTDRISRQGFHGDLSEDERCILLATFYMRHRDDTMAILKELVDRKTASEGMGATETSCLEAMT